MSLTPAQAPRPLDAVRAIAELIGPMQPNIYGQVFDVVSSGDAAINLAYATAPTAQHRTPPRTPSPSPSRSRSPSPSPRYTTEAIGAHMDLCYYESPPGLQLLHCLRFDET